MCSLPAMWNVERLVSSAIKVGTTLILLLLRSNLLKFGNINLDLLHDAASVDSLIS